MSIFNTTGPSPSNSVSLIGAQNPSILNISMPLASTEYSTILPANTTKFLIKLRGLGDMKLGYTSGGSSTLYISIPRFTFYSEDQLSIGSSLTLYFQASTAGHVAEIVYWTT